MGAIVALVLALGALILFALDGGESSDPRSVATSETAPAAPTTGVALPVTTVSGGVVPTASPITSTTPSPLETIASSVPSAPSAPTASSAPTAPITTSPGVTAPVVAASPFILNDPLPSGLSGADAASSLAVAQRLADAFSTGDWAAVRRLAPATAGYSDQNFIDGYAGVDRIALLLVDAQPAPGGLRLLFVSVANELGGAQTSLYCLEWTADPDDGTIEQHGGTVGLIARVSSVVSSEDVRNDQELMDVIGTRCRWT